MNCTLVIVRVWPGINGAGGAIFTGKRCDDDRSMRCRADGDHIFRPPSLGELWEVTGELKTHPLYGDQLEVEHALPVAAKGRLIVSYLSYSPDFSGIGRAKAERLWAAFGDELPNVLARGDSEALAPHLCETDIANLLAGWRHNLEPEVIAFLDQYGFPLRVASRAIRIWPQDTIPKLQENPYRLLAICSWPDTDRAAMRLGVAPDDPRRLIGAVEAVLYGELSENHTVTPRKELLARLKSLLPTLPANVIDEAISHAIADKACVETDLGYCTVGAHYMETCVAQWLADKKVPLAQGSVFAATLPSLVDMEIAKHTATHPAPSAEQRAAVVGIFQNSLYVLTGGAGTGKTTVLRLVHSVADQLGRQVIQMCLAGRAAKRLTEATGRDALTITRFFLRHETLLTQNGEPIVIVDEASMVDLPSIYLLTKVLPQRATLVLVGDAAQLPPIGFGLVFHRLAVAEVPRQTLTRVYRQGQASSIPVVAEQIRRIDDPLFPGSGRVPTLPPFTPGDQGAFFVETSPDNVAELVLQLQRQLGAQILCATHRGEVGDNKLNAYCHRRFVGTTEDALGIQHAVGEPVIFGKNDYQRATVQGAPSVLWNGSLGTVVDVQNEPEYCLIVDFDGEHHLLKGEDLFDLRHAFAITVHRAQGSQFPVVLIPVVPARNVDRTWIYTALTRAEHTAIFVGSRDVFEKAVKLPPHSDLRRVRLDLGLAWKESVHLLSSPSEPDSQRRTMAKN